MTEVSHDKNNARYIIEVDGEIAGFAEYSESGSHRVFDHTVVEEKFQGRGLSKPLIKAALDDTKAQGMAYSATCSAVERFMEKNPGY